jgi:predicted PilT family ATPase
VFEPKETVAVGSIETDSELLDDAVGSGEIDSVIRPSGLVIDRECVSREYVFDKLVCVLGMEIVYVAVSSSETEGELDFVGESDCSVLEKEAVTSLDSERESVSLSETD